MSYEKLGFVKGQKLKADHLNHMEEGIANASSGGSADWLQNDENGAGYVKNRTHWEEVGEVARIDNQTIECELTEEEGMSWVEYYNGNVNTSVALVEGDTYTVVLDGVTYNDLICGSDVDGCPCIGGEVDDVIAGRGTIPFFMTTNVSTDIDGASLCDLCIAISSTETTHTISVYHKTNIIHKLDPKYLPDNIGGGAGFEYFTGKVTAEGSDSLVLGINFDALHEKYLEIELAAVLHGSSSSDPFFKCSFVLPEGSMSQYLAIPMAEIRGTGTPHAILRRTDGGSIKVSFVSGDSVKVDNPSLVYARLYPRV